MKHASVQTARLGIEAIQEGVVALVGGEYRAVLEVSGTASPFEDDARQEALLAGFATFLNALSFPIQILVRASPVDLSRYAASLEERGRQMVEGQLAALAQDHAAFVQGARSPTHTARAALLRGSPGRERRAGGLGEAGPGRPPLHRTGAAPRGGATPAHLPLRRPLPPAQSLRPGGQTPCGPGAGAAVSGLLVT